jgi:COP9 signalosome complex subunit 1
MSSQDESRPPVTEHNNIGRLSNARNIDLTSYIQKYKGFTVIQRLLFIANKAKQDNNNTELLKQACEELVNVVKTSSGMNVKAYREAIEIATGKKLVGDSDGDNSSNNDNNNNNNNNNSDNNTDNNTNTNSATTNYESTTITSSALLTVDEDWVEKANNRSNELQAQLEHDLETYKQNLIKESIRMGHNDLASFHLRCGDLKNALAYHLKNRDYCTTRKHAFDMCLNIITVALYLGNHALVQSQAMKGQHIPSLQENAIANVDRGKLDVALGLAHLSKKDYYQAAFSFLNVPTNLNNNFASVAHIEDVAIYGTLCGLATFGRNAVKTKLLNNENVRNMLELVPSMRELVNDFYSGKYGSCLSFLDSFRQHLDIDIYFSPHVDTIIEQINYKAITQYFSAFISVKLPVMASALNITVEKLEKDAATLIEKGKLNAKIDSHLKVLHAKSSNQRRQAFEDAINSGEEFIAEANLTMLRMNIAKYGFVHDDNIASGGGGRKSKTSTSTTRIDGGGGIYDGNAVNSATIGSNKTVNGFDFLDDIQLVTRARITESQQKNSKK